MIMKEGRLIWQGRWEAGKEDMETFYISIINGDKKSC
jgi:hypothetical protein